MRNTILSVLLGALSACASLADGQPVARVRAERVNLRGRPDANGEVVGQAAAGDLLKVVQTGEVWYAVSPPEKVRCWIHKDFVQDGKVTVKELTVRAGASINYPRIGSLFRGDAVTPRETFGDWLCIPPPTNAAVWIHRELLDVPPAAKVAAETSPLSVPNNSEPAADSSPVLPVATNEMAVKISPSNPTAPASEATTPLQHQAVVMPPRVMAGATGSGTPTNSPPQVPADLNLIPVPGQGSVVQHEGFVKSSPYVLAPGRYRLAVRKGSQLETVCFLRGNTQQLATLVDEYFMMQGREYWVQGVREPLLVIERIERRPKPGQP